MRTYWIAWNGSYDGFQEFSRRNRMNPGVGVPNGHAIGQYVQELIPKGKSVFNVPVADDATAEHIAKKIAPQFAAGKDMTVAPGQAMCPAFLRKGGGIGSCNFDIS